MFRLNMPDNNMVYSRTKYQGLYTICVVMMDLAVCKTDYRFNCSDIEINKDTYPNFVFVPGNKGQSDFMIINSKIQDYLLKISG